MPEPLREHWLNRLARAHDSELDKLQSLDAYYEGRQRLSYMHPELLPRLGERVRQLVVNWPRLVVDSLEERLDIVGFRLGGQSRRDEELWRIWQYNDLDAGYQQAHTDAMVMRRSYVLVGSNEDDPDTPLVTVESPLQMHVELDPRTRRVRAALKRWSDTNPAGDREWFATLYLPQETVSFTRDAAAGWRVSEVDEHGLGAVPVVPVVNRPRTMRPLGESELTDVIPLSDAACKIATDMMVSAEFHAMPRRYALGFDQEDFTDADGRPLTPWEAVAGLIWATPKSPRDDGVAVGQFPEANLANFHDTLNSLARLVASISGLPPHFLGYSTENPASAEAIRSSEARLVKRAERRQRGFESAWEQVLRLVYLVRDDEIPEQARRIETMWTDAATPTIAAQADATVKLFQADQLLPRRAARRALGYTDGQIRDMEAEDREALTRVISDPAAQYGPKPGTDDEGGGAWSISPPATTGNNRPLSGGPPMPRNTPGGNSTRQTSPTPGTQASGSGPPPRSPRRRPMRLR
ncbi:phage portal protein [Saccharopolyspora hattusasensis]|uniref:phage portal protein n=1 Tax=Saccharopolyspora hattusasensis TaxID=1128679 RepID=UPI003D99F91A